MPAAYKTISAAWAAMLIVVAGAHAQSGVSAKDWLNSPDSSFAFPLSAPVVKIPYIVVAKGAREDAIQILDRDPIAPLTEKDAKYYAGEEALADLEYNALLAGHSAAMPFLVRGVNPNPGGACSIDLADDALSIVCVSLGGFAYEKRPYVVLLDKRPSHVFVYAMSAQ